MWSEFNTRETTNISLIFRWQMSEAENMYITNPTFLNVPSLVGRRGRIIIFYYDFVF